MKIIANQQNGFDIIETIGRKILNKYIDFCTKLFVVEELDEFESIIYYITIDVELIQIVNYEMRKAYINYNELLQNLLNLNLTLKSKRVLNELTGKEIIDEQLLDKIGNVVFSRQILAFNEKRIVDIEELYIENNLHKEKERLFWIDEYPNYSIDNKVKYWVANIHHGMRMQGGATNDPYSEFSEEWYEYVKSKENDFDFIFGEVVPRLGIDFNWDEYHRRIKKSI